MQTVVIGDIEADMSIFAHTINILRETNPQTRVVFLGDIIRAFNAESTTTSINIIRNIFNVLDISVNEAFTPDNVTDLLYIKEVYDEMYINNEFHVVNMKTPQYWHGKPHCSTPSDQRIVFLAGNQELEFVFDIVNATSVRYCVEADTIRLSTRYYDVYQKRSMIKVMQMSLNDFNVLTTYVSLLTLYFIDDYARLFIHNFVNASYVKRKFVDIVCGHNKGVGRFEYTRGVVYMLDLTESFRRGEIADNCILFEGGRCVKMPDVRLEPQGDKFKNNMIRTFDPRVDVS